MVTLELVLSPAVEEVVFASAAFQKLRSLRSLTLQGRLPQHRRRMHRRALPHVSPSVTRLTAHSLNLTDTDWSHYRHVQSLDLSHSGVCCVSRPGGRSHAPCSITWPDMQP